METMCQGTQERTVENEETENKKHSRFSFLFCLDKRLRILTKLSHEYEMTLLKLATFYIESYITLKIPPSATCNLSIKTVIPLKQITHITL